MQWSVAWSWRLVTGLCNGSFDQRLLRRNAELDFISVAQAFHKREEQFEHIRLLEVRGLGIWMRVVNLAEHRCAIGRLELHIKERKILCWFRRMPLHLA